MKVKTAIVTGANGGIGREITRGMVQRGYRVIMACRSREKAEEAACAIRCQAMTESIPLDLSSFESILGFVQQIKDRGIEIDALINNSGVMCKDFSTTRQGFEMSVGVNYVGTYLLTRLLLPLMESSGAIVNMISCTYKIGKVDEEFFSSDPQRHERFEAYSKSKLGLLLFTAELSRRLQGGSLKVNAADPGVVNTGMISMQRWYDPLADVFFRPFIKSPAKGALAAVRAAQETVSTSGEIYYSKKIKAIPQKIWDHPFRERLWEMTEEALEEKSGLKLKEMLT